MDRNIDHIAEIRVITAKDSLRKIFVNGVASSCANEKIINVCNSTIFHSLNQLRLMHCYCSRLYLKFCRILSTIAKGTLKQCRMNSERARARGKTANNKSPLKSLSASQSNMEHPSSEPAHTSEHSFAFVLRKVRANSSLQHATYARYNCCFFGSTLISFVTCACDRVPYQFGVRIKRLTQWKRATF